MITHIEPDIKFMFKKDTVLKYDDSPIHTKCKHTSTKAVDFIYKYSSKLLLIEVKDFNRNLTNKTEFVKNQILKESIKSLELHKENPFESFVNKIIQKLNDTLLSLYSSMIYKSKQELSRLNQRIKEIVFVLVLDLPNELKEYMSTIQDKIEQYILKYSCMFDIQFLLIDSNSKLRSFEMEKI